MGWFNLPSGIWSCPDVNLFSSRLHNDSRNTKDGVSVPRPPIFLRNRVFNDVSHARPTEFPECVHFSPGRTRGQLHTVRARSPIRCTFVVWFFSRIKEVKKESEDNHFLETMCLSLLLSVHNKRR